MKRNLIELNLNNKKKTKLNKLENYKKRKNELFENNIKKKICVEELNYDLLKWYIK
jgi:hypothetical protein